MAENQGEMFDIPERNRGREARGFHAAVIFLRGKRVAVYRFSPTQSKVNGSLIDNRRVVSLAKTMGFKI